MRNAYLPCLKLILILVMVPGAQAATAPQSIVRDTTTAVLDRIESRRGQLAADPRAVESVAQELIVPHFDMETMARLALDGHWESLDGAARECFVSGFGRLLVERYARILLSYDDQDIDYGPVRDLGAGGSVAVTQTVSRAGATPLPIDYVMRQDGNSNGWRVVDLVVDGVSLVRNYRGMFQVDIHQFGLEEFLRGLGPCPE